MSKYDQVINQAQAAKDEQVSQQNELKRLSDQVKQRHIEALKKELPGFYQALLKTNKWTKKKIYTPFLFLRIPRTIECFDFNDLYLSKDGKYYRRKTKVYEYRVSVTDTEINEDQFADAIYSRMAPAWNTKEYLERILKSDIQERAFNYFADRIRELNSK